MTEMHGERVDGELPPELREAFGKLRNRYGSVPPPPPGPALSAFLDVGLTQRAPDLPMAAGDELGSRTSNRRRAMSSITTFLGTAIGKVVLGTTVAAASIGAGQATGAINVLPVKAPAVTNVRSGTPAQADEPETTVPDTTEPETTEPETTEPETTEPDTSVPDVGGVPAPGADDPTNTDDDHSDTADDPSSTDDDHASTDDDHASTDDDHASTDDDHASTDDDHASTDDDHASTDDDHASTDDDHASTDDSGSND
jgi:hypothetical protein